MQVGGKQGGAENAISALGWNPNGSHQLLAAAVGSNVVLIVTGTGDSDAKGVTAYLHIYQYTLWVTLSIHNILLTINIPSKTLYQYTLSLILSLTLSTPYQHTLSTHLINATYQHTLSKHPFNTPYQPTLSSGTGDSDASEVTETLLSEAEEQALKNGPIVMKGTQDQDDEEEEAEEEAAEEEEEEDNTKARKKIISTWHLHPSRNTPTSTGKGKKRATQEEINPLGRVGRHGELVGPRLTLRLLSKSASGKGVAPLTKLVWHHKGDHTHSQYIISTHSILIKHSIINQTLLYHYPYH